MSKLADRVREPGFDKSVRRYELVLDFITDIEDEMRRRKIKRSGLAALLGKSRAWISKVMNKQPNLTFFTAYDIADALNMDLEVRARPRRKHHLVIVPNVDDDGETISRGAHARVDFRVAIGAES